MICQPRQSPAPPRAGLSLSLRIRKSTPPAVPGRRGTYSVIRPTNCQLRGTHNPFPGILPCRILTAKLHILAPILVIQIDRHVQIVDVVHIPYSLRYNETAAAVLAGRILTHRPAYLIGTSLTAPSFSSVSVSPLLALPLGASTSGQYTTLPFFSNIGSIRMLSSDAAS